MLAAMSDRNEVQGLLTLAVHELRTPLNVAAGYLRMLLDPRSGTLADRQAQLAGKAADSLETLTRLVADLGEIARLESGEIPAARRRHDLAALAASVVEAFTPPHPAAARAVLDAQPGNYPADLDTERVARALRACLDAVAREAADASVVTVSLARRDSSAAGLTVAPRDRLPSLDPAASAWGAPDEWRGGLGLELPLARRVIERHGGRLLSPLDPDRQPAFLVVLPLSAGQ